jgi:hypothetical protein
METEFYTVLGWSTATVSEPPLDWFIAAVVVGLLIMLAAWRINRSLRVGPYACLKTPGTRVDLVVLLVFLAFTYWAYGAEQQYRVDHRNLYVSTCKYTLRSNTTKEVITHSTEAPQSPKSRCGHVGPEVLKLTTREQTLFIGLK